jgi:ParB family chromosome partitioning protein
LYRSDGRYIVIDGERRLRAMMDLGITDLIVGRDVVVDMEETDADIRFKQVIANIQREGINDVELGHAFLMLNEQYGYQYKEVADIIGKTPHYVTAKVGLAKRLSPEVQALYVADIEAAKCIPDTSPDEPEIEETPYVMSVNVVQGIARLPTGLQMQSFIEIKDKQMDKKEALKYLQSVRANNDNASVDNKIGDTDAAISKKEEKSHEIVMKRYLNRLDKDVDRIVVQVKSGEHRRDEKVIPALESLISKLQSLYAELKAANIETTVDGMTIY